MADSGDKTEDPTPKRLREARNEGQFPRTGDASTWVAMAGATAVLALTGRRTKAEFDELMHYLPEVAKDPTATQALRALAVLPMAVLSASLPLMVTAFLGALLITAAQGVHPSKKAVKPKFKRLSPKQGIKRMFGMQAIWEAAKALLKVIVVSVTVLLVGRSLVVTLMGGGTAPLAATLQTAWHGLRSVLWAAIAAGGVLAVADYAYQRHRVMKQLRMSPREIKDEHKQQEGDPLIKSAIRSRQIAMSRNRMLSAVSTADAVLVNPTHVAVAIKYEPGRGAPKVVAKGAGALAAKIREKAREHRVPILEDKPLARALYQVCEVGEEIPTELYMAVARILAFVMATARGRGAGMSRPATSTLPALPTRAELHARRARELRAARRVGPQGRPPGADTDARAMDGSA